jgi:hypothetical protein
VGGGKRRSRTPCGAGLDLFFRNLLQESFQGRYHGLPCVQNTQLMGAVSGSTCLVESVSSDRLRQRVCRTSSVSSSNRKQWPFGRQLFAGSEEGAVCGHSSMGAGIRNCLSGTSVTLGTMQLLEVFDECAKSHWCRLLRRLPDVAVVAKRLSVLCRQLLVVRAFCVPCRRPCRQCP